MPGSYWNGPGGQAGSLRTAQERPARPGEARSERPVCAPPHQPGEAGRYWLPPHVFLCTSARHTVFLDLRADRYFAVETEAATPVLRRIEGWESSHDARAGDPGSGGEVPEGHESPVGHKSAGALDTASGLESAGGLESGRGRDSAEGRAPAQEQRIERLARSLLDRGLLTCDGGRGKRVAVAYIDAPRDDLTDVGLIEPPPLLVRDVVRFALALTLAWAVFRTLPLSHLVHRVSRRRMKRNPCTAPGLDPALAKRCVAAYERLRPLAFTARDACLFESFVFLELAARYGLYPLWVFGVQTTPFAAHCWVQQGSLVLNDSAEHAAGYTPIMSA